MRLDGIQQSIELAHTIDDKLNTEYDHYLLNPKMSEPRAKPQQNDFVTGSIQNNNREQSTLGVKSQLVKKRNDQILPQQDQIEPQGSHLEQGQNGDVLSAQELSVDLR